MAGKGKVQAIQWSARVIDGRKGRSLELYIFCLRSIHCYATH